MEEEKKTDTNKRIKTKTAKAYYLTATTKISKEKRCEWSIKNNIEKKINIQLNVYCEWKEKVASAWKAFELPYWCNLEK